MKQLPLIVDPFELPTGKFHISFSELAVYETCPYRHKLQYIDKVLPEKENEHLIFGHTIHECTEHYLLNIDNPTWSLIEQVEESQEQLSTSFNKIKFKDDGTWSTALEEIAEEFPDWMDKTFFDWKTVAAEFPLFEQIAPGKPRWFKGYIDAIIKCSTNYKVKSNRQVHWILDMKSCGWGWSKEQIIDPNKRMQLVLYKHFYSKKMNIPLEDIKCGFVLLKRTAKTGKRCELIDVSVGEKTINHSLSTMNNMMNCVSKKLFTKNRFKCGWCSYNGTPFCR